MAKQKGSPLNGVSSLYLTRLQAERCTTLNDCTFAEKYPQLASLLGDNRVTEDEVCDPAALRVSNNGGDWLFSLSVPGLGMYGDTLSRTFDGGLAAIEQALGGGTFPWKVNLKKKRKVRKIEEQKS